MRRSADVHVKQKLRLSFYKVIYSQLWPAKLAAYGLARYNWQKIVIIKDIQALTLVPIQKQALDQALISVTILLSLMPGGGNAEYFYVAWFWVKPTNPQVLAL